MKTWIQFSLIAVVTMVFSVSQGQQKSAPHAQQKKDTDLAQVGPRAITMSDFNVKYQDVVMRTMNPPTKRQFLEDLIRFEIGVLEAEKANLRKDPLVQERINQEGFELISEFGKKLKNISDNAIGGFLEDGRCTVIVHSHNHFA